MSVAKKLSQLPVAETLSGEERVLVEQGGQSKQASVAALLAPVDERLTTAESSVDAALTTGRNALSAANYVLGQLHTAMRSDQTLFVLDRDLAVPPPLAVSADFSFYVVLAEHFAGWSVPENMRGGGPLLAWYGPNPQLMYPAVRDESDGSYDLNYQATSQWHFFGLGVGMQLYVQDERAWYEVVASDLTWGLERLAVIKFRGEWDMTGATAIPYADPARDVGLETIDPQSVEISRFRIVAGGVPIYGGAAYMHHQSSSVVATNTGDQREAWTELQDFGADNSAINVILMVYADEAMTAQDLLDVFFQNPAAAEKEFYLFAWMWSPTRTTFSISTRSGASRTGAGDSVSVAALPVGTPLALRMDWATGRPSIFRQDNATDLLTATNCQMQAPAGMRFRPWLFAMTMGTDAIASTQAVPYQYNLGNSLVSGFVGISDAERPEGARVGDAYVVSAPGNYGGKSAALGNVVMLHPTINDLIVLATDPSQYVTKVDLAGRGYQTADQVQEALAAVAGINRKAILIDYANYVLTAADSGRMVIQRVNGLSPVLDGAQNYPGDWYAFVLNVSPNGAVNPVYIGTSGGAYINGDSSFRMEEGCLYVLENIGGAGFRAQVVWRAGLDAIRSIRRVNTTTGVGVDDYLGTICFEPDTGANDQLNIADSGGVSYAKNFYCSVINRSSTARPLFFINPQNDQLEGENGNIPPGKACTLVRHGEAPPYRWSLY